MRCFIFSSINSIFITQLFRSFIRTDDDNESDDSIDFTTKSARRLSKRSKFLEFKNVEKKKNFSYFLFTFYVHLS